MIVIYLFFFVAIIFYYRNLSLHYKNFFNFNLKKIIFAVLIINLSLCFFLTNYWVKFSNLRWEMSKNFIIENNLSSFNLKGGHTWNYEKYKEYAKTFNPSQIVIDHKNIINLNDYKYNISFSPADDIVKKGFLKTYIFNKEIFINKL
jgi:hypothetical protein